LGLVWAFGVFFLEGNAKTLHKAEDFCGDIIKRMFITVSGAKSSAEFLTQNFDTLQEE